MFVVYYETFITRHLALCNLAVGPAVLNYIDFPSFPLCVSRYVWYNKYSETDSKEDSY